MGSQTSKLVIQFHNNGFNAGSTLSGNAYVSFKAYTTVDYFNFKLKGVEKVHIQKKLNDKIDDYYGSNDIFKLEFRSPGGAYMPGTYCIPFSINLPHHLPASLSYHDVDEMGLIRYNLKVQAFYHNRVIAVDKDPFVVYPYIPPIVPLSKSERVNLSRCCCIDKKSVVIAASVGKSFFLPGEPIEVNVSVWNESEEDIRSVHVSLKHSLELKTIGHGATKHFERGKTVLPGLKIGENFEGKKCMILPIGDCSIPSALGAIVKSEYTIHVSVDRSCAINQRITIPVLIGPAKVDQSVYMNKFASLQSFASQCNTLSPIAFNVTDVSPFYKNYNEQLFNGVGTIDYSNNNPHALTYNPYSNASAPLTAQQNYGPVQNPPPSIAHQPFVPRSAQHPYQPTEQQPLLAQYHSQPAIQPGYGR